MAATLSGLPAVTAFVRCLLSEAHSGLLKRSPFLPPFDTGGFFHQQKGKPPCTRQYFCHHLTQVAFSTKGKPPVTSCNVQVYASGSRFRVSSSSTDVTRTLPSDRDGWRLQVQSQDSAAKKLCGSEVKSQGYAGLSLWFHLPCHFGTSS